jgi:putative NIF3 family GTP cyclohydrolase 1 type 2
MNISEIYQLAIKLGKENDPRGLAEVEQGLTKAGKEFAELKEEKRGEFDQSKLTNPYSDTRILHGAGDKEIKRVLVGVDIEVGEVLLADRLREKGQGIDLIIAHHPEGKALAALHDVMHMQEGILHKFGVPINVAEGIMASRISEVKRGLMPLNHNKAVDAARILDLPLMCVHTPADNLVTAYVQKFLDEKQPETLDDILKVLKEIPEYAEAVKTNAGPAIFAGSGKRKAGKIFVDMTGGTGGSEDAYAKLSQAGVGTLVGMHIGEKHRKEAEKNHVNVVIAGHIASDSLGMNLFLDHLASRGIEIVACSGITRIQR